MHNILDHLLNYKNGIETSEKLEIELEQAVKRTLQDNTFRWELFEMWRKKKEMYNNSRNKIECN